MPSCKVFVTSGAAPRGVCQFLGHSQLFTGALIGRKVTLGQAEWHSAYPAKFVLWYLGVSTLDCLQLWLTVQQSTCKVAKSHLDQQAGI